MGLSLGDISLMCQLAHTGAEVDSNSPVVIHPCFQPILINNLLHDVHCHVGLSPLLLDIIKKWPYENVDG
jgi:hypothetical protein